MTKTIYLIRHGETNSKKQKKFQSHNTPLSAHGADQVNKKSGYFLNKNINLIESSPIKRAVQTATIIHERLLIDCTINHDLQEIKNPEDIQGKHYSDMVADDKYRLWLSKLRKLESLNRRNEENYFDLFKRTSSIIIGWENSNHDNIVAVSHSVTIRSILSFILCNGVISSQYMDMLEKIKIDNCGVVIVSYTSTGWRVNIEN